jgi:type 1 glutamine amidotransferase
MLIGPAAKAAEPKKILVVTTTTGFRHSSIATAEKVLAKLAEQSGAFTLDYARQPAGKPADPGYESAMKESLSKLSADSLKGYDAVIFANTTGDLPLPDRQAFLDWVGDGHAFIGMHSASDTYHGFPPYIEMLGGEFQTHGAQVGVECLVQDMKHPATKHLGESYCLEQEEIYLIKSYDKAEVHELLVLDKHPNKKKEAGHFPVAWVKEYRKGKVFYTSLGHRENVWESERYQKHILGGIKWALGLEPGDAKPQASVAPATQPNAPQQAAK